MGLQFNIITATVSAVLAAALAGYPGAPKPRVWWSGVVLLAGWAVGDGIRVAGSVGSGSRAAAYGVVWALAGLAVGYVLPALAGAAVGRAVFRGTGWLAASAVALMLTPAVWALSERLSGLAWAAVR